MDVVNFLKDKTRIPVIGAPLFTVSYPELVLAQCKAGVVGSFPALNARPEEKLGEWISMMKQELLEYKEQNPDAVVAPFAVNQICHHSNNRLEHDMNVCVEHEVPIIITSLRAPKFVVDAVHSYGGAVMHDVINIRHAKKAVDEGADGLILVCAGAGGHAGTLSPFALVREVREFFDGPVALSGSISHGASVLSAQAMGADFAYVGTRFIATQEANASDGYKDMIVDFRGIPTMRGFAPTVLDVTHSLQQPNQSSGVTGGRPEMIETIARAGIVNNVDGLFIETHYDPSNAKSDGANMLHLNHLEKLLTNLTAIKLTVNSL